MPKQKKEIAEPITEIENENKDNEKRDFSGLIKQVEAEYQLAWWFMKPKLDEWAVRLKLYNNQKRI
jgi:hypothetical protein